jgi:hypothetical protein
MELTTSPRSEHEHLERVLERQIEHRTNHRVRRLRVEITSERVVVHGYSLSYYVKQLALQAVLDALRAIKGPPVELNIEVGTAIPREQHM